MICFMYKICVKILPKWSLFKDTMIIEITETKIVFKRKMNFNM